MKKNPARQLRQRAPKHERRSREQRRDGELSARQLQRAAVRRQCREEPLAARSTCGAARVPKGDQQEQCRRPSSRHVGGSINRRTATAHTGVSSVSAGRQLFGSIDQAAGRLPYAWPMFANFGEDQQRRDRLARQNKDHLDALRAQLESDRMRKRNERSGFPAPPQRFLPGQDPSNASAPVMLKSPPAGAPYYAARQLAPEAALPHEFEQRWRAMPPQSYTGARQAAAPPAAAVGQGHYDLPLQHDQEHAFGQQQADRYAAVAWKEDAHRVAEDVVAAQYARQEQEQQDFEVRQREKEQLWQQEALALHRDHSGTENGMRRLRATIGLAFMHMHMC
eukprot:scaffold14374_cov208-Isochrysis_galbana.AAC.1